MAVFGETAASLDCTGISFGQVCFLVLLVNGRGLAALLPEASAFGLEIMALWSFYIKLPVSQTWTQVGFAFLTAPPLPALTPGVLPLPGDALAHFLSSLLAPCPLPVTGAHILLPSAAGTS